MKIEMEAAQQPLYATGPRVLKPIETWTLDREDAVPQQPRIPQMPPKIAELRASLRLTPRAIFQALLRVLHREHAYSLRRCHRK